MSTLTLCIFSNTGDFKYSQRMILRHNRLLWAGSSNLNVLQSPNTPTRECAAVGQYMSIPFTPGNDIHQTTKLVFLGMFISIQIFGWLILTHSIPEHPIPLSPWPLATRKETCAAPPHSVGAVAVHQLLSSWRQLADSSTAGHFLP